MTSYPVKRILFVSLKIFLALTLFLLILGSSALIFIQTDTGREFARNQLNQLVSGKIQGKFELKHLDELGFNRVVARDLVVTAQNGEKVLELKQISYTPAWRELFFKKVQGSSVSVTGGVVRLTDTGHGLSISKAFKKKLKPKDEKGAPPKKGKPIALLFEGIHAKDLELQITAKKVPPLHVKDINTYVRLELENKILTLRFDKASAHVDLPVLGDTKIRQLSGQVKTKTFEAVKFKLNLELGDLVPTRLTYLVPKYSKKPGKPKMIVRFSKEKSPSFFSKLILEMADASTEALDVGFEP